MWNNRVILSGNLVKDVEVKVTEGKDSKHVTSFTVAVHRTRSKEDTADFINCVAWGVQADYLGHLHLRSHLYHRLFLANDVKKMLGNSPASFL